MSPVVTAYWCGAIFGCGGAVIGMCALTTFREALKRERRKHR